MNTLLYLLATVWAMGVLILMIWHTAEGIAGEEDADPTFKEVCAFCFWPLILAVGLVAAAYLYLFHHDLWKRKRRW